MAPVLNALPLWPPAAGVSRRTSPTCAASPLSCSPDTLEKSLKTRGAAPALLAYSASAAAKRPTCFIFGPSFGSGAFPVLDRGRTLFDMSLRRNKIHLGGHWTPSNGAVVAATGDFVGGHLCGLWKCAAQQGGPLGRQWHPLRTAHNLAHDRP